MHVVLDEVPLRDQTMTCEEILMSESQERMCAIAEPDKVDQFLKICAKWEVLAAVIGTVNNSGRLTVEWRGEQIVDVPPRTVAHDGPVYERPLSRPPDQDDLQADDPDRLPRPSSPDELRDTMLRLIAHPNLADKSWVTEQYDSYVRGNTVLSQPEDAGVLRIDEQTHRGIALSTDGNGRYGRLDPYVGAQLAVAEAYRNVATTGATPIAITDCLNFGSPEEPAVMWQFSESIRGIADACRELGLPVTGGNVSFYNQTGDVAIHPTPVIGVLGVLDDVRLRLRQGLGRVVGEQIALLGQTRAEFGGSQWAGVMHGHLGGLPPTVDLAAEAQLAAVLAQAAAHQWLTAAHDVSDGGLAATLTESVLRYGMGAQIRLPGDLFVALFAESSGRVLVAGTLDGLAALEAACAVAEILITRLGTAGGDQLAIKGVTSIPLADLRTAWTETLPRLFGAVTTP
jgi:phosphoribosylformylglycinamidine synthase